MISVGKLPVGQQLDFWVSCWTLYLPQSFLLLQIPGAGLCHHCNCRRPSTKRCSAISRPSTEYNVRYFPFTIFETIDDFYYMISTKWRRLNSLARHQETLWHSRVLILVSVCTSGTWWVNGIKVCMTSVFLITDITLASQGYPLAK